MCFWCFDLFLQTGPLHRVWTLWRKHRSGTASLDVLSREPPVGQNNLVFNTDNNTTTKQQRNNKTTRKRQNNDTTKTKQRQNNDETTTKQRRKNDETTPTATTQRKNNDKNDETTTTQRRNKRRNNNEAATQHRNNDKTMAKQWRNNNASYVVVSFGFDVVLMLLCSRWASSCLAEAPIRCAPKLLCRWALENAAQAFLQSCLALRSGAQPLGAHKLHSKTQIESAALCAAALCFTLPCSDLLCAWIYTGIALVYNCV